MHSKANNVKHHIQNLNFEMIIKMNKNSTVLPCSALLFDYSAVELLVHQCDTGLQNLQKLLIIYHNKTTNLPFLQGLTFE